MISGVPQGSILQIFVHCNFLLMMFLTRIVYVYVQDILMINAFLHALVPEVADAITSFKCEALCISNKIPTLVMVSHFDGVIW